MRKIDRLSVLCEKENITVVMGIDGSKTLDAAKAVARRQGVRVAVVPTLASNDAPCSALSVICTPEDQFERSLFLPRNPDLVLLDTAVIARAPARFPSSGMGNALAAQFEANAVTPALEHIVEAKHPAVRSRL